MKERRKSMNIYDFKIADIKKRLFLADTFDTVQFNWTVSIKSAGCTLCKNCNKNIRLSSLSAIFD